MLPDWVIRLILAVGISLAGWAFYRLVNLVLLKRAGSKSGRLPDLRKGKPAIVYFTTPDCVPCKTIQRPALARLRQMAGDEIVQIIEINAYERDDLAKEWGVLSVPTTFLLDARGIPRRVNHGVTPADKLYKQLQQVRKGSRLDETESYVI